MGQARRPDKTTAEIASEDIEKLATRSVRASTVSGEPDVDQAGSTTSAAQIPKEDLHRPTTKIHTDDLLGLLRSPTPAVPTEVVTPTPSNSHVIARDEPETVTFTKPDDGAPDPEKLEEIAKLVGVAPQEDVAEDRDRKTEIMVANDFKMLLRHGVAGEAAPAEPLVPPVEPPAEKLPRATTVSYDEADDKAVAARRRPASDTLPDPVAYITQAKPEPEPVIEPAPEPPRRRTMQRFERLDSEPSVPRRSDLNLMIGAVVFILALIVTIAAIGLR